MYTIQFTVLQQNENDTWYDPKGNIMFTCSKGLAGVGCDRKEWGIIRGEQLDGNTYAGVVPTSVHTIAPKMSELYGGEQVAYYASYTAATASLTIAEHGNVLRNVSRIWIKPLSYSRF